MSNSYASYSASLQITSEEECAWLEKHLNRDIADWVEERQMTPKQLKYLLEWYGVEEPEDWRGFEASINAEKSALWIHGDSLPDHLPKFIQNFLKEFRPDGHWTLEWAETCDKPLLDAFGGGAAFVTATEIKYFHTSEWVTKQRGAFE